MTIKIVRIAWCIIDDHKTMLNTQGDNNSSSCYHLHFSWSPHTQVIKISY